MTKCERYRVSGHVQGVGFRAATLREATRLGLCGWVRNLPDGRVEVLAQGLDDQLQQLSAWLRHGPVGAKVAQVDSTPDSQVPPVPGFQIR